MLRNLESLGYQEMTPIQAKSLPLVLKNQDLIVKAKTGSGKTVAFGLGLIAKLSPSVYTPQSLVICPTRELADQVSKVLRSLARMIPNICVLTLCGGKPFGMQAEALSKKVHIVVGTPGRIQDHIERKTLNLKNIKTLVLDEADRMLDMGFYDEILHIIKQLPLQRQTLLFSATYPDAIAKISESFQQSPIEIHIEDEAQKPNIEQIAYQVSEHEKDEALIALIAHYKVQSAIVFCRTKIKCDEVASALCHQGVHALAIHSSLEQRDREEVLLQFANNSCSILVATDVAARGLDIKDLPLVINYDLPSSPEDYVHRIGRTGRAGNSGLAISLFSQGHTFKIEAIEAYTNTLIQRMDKDTLTSSCVFVKPSMKTLCINAGKKNKIRPGDILGALTGDGGLKGTQVGKIDIFDFNAYVAIDSTVSSSVLRRLQSAKIKGRTFKMRYLNNQFRND